MMHSFVLRIPLAGSASAPPVEPARLARLQDQGWRLTQPMAGVDGATTGDAGYCEAADWGACGLAFLQDRDGVTHQLDMSPQQAAEKSDLELLLDLRLAKGQEFIHTVYGSFSLVFIHKETGRFEAYRDHLGVYPLYYTVSDGAVTCASDLRACLHLSGVALSADAVRIADFIKGDEVDFDKTAFDAVLRLPPAHQLEPVNQTVSPRRYWKLEIPQETVSTDCAEQLRDALQAATLACMRPEGSVGAMLSGGLDSSALAGLAAKQSGAPVQTVSFVYGADKAYDETRYIDAANETFGSIPHKIAIAGAPPLDDLATVLDEQMDLFLAPGLPKARQIYPHARALGLSAVIDGHGGDEVISHGYGRLVELATHRKFSLLYREARGAAKVHSLPFLALFSSHIAHYSGMGPRNPLRRLFLKLARYQTKRSSISGWSGTPISLITSDLQERIAATERYAPDPLLKTKVDFNRAESLTHLKALNAPLMAQAFEVFHRSATAAEVLPRYPFFDRRVISLCLAFPAEMKLRDGRSRWILREAMRDILPESIRTRADKAEFGDEIFDVVRDFYSDKEISFFEPMSDFVSVDAAEQLRKQVIVREVTDVAAIRALWRLAVLSYWIKGLKGWCDAQVKGILI